MVGTCVGITLFWGDREQLTFQLQIVRALIEVISDNSTISEVVIVINRVFERGAGVVRSPGIRRFVCEKHAKKVFLGGFANFFTIFGQLCECSTTNSFFLNSKFACNLVGILKEVTMKFQSYISKLGAFTDTVRIPKTGKPQKAFGTKFCRCSRYPRFQPYRTNEVPI